MASSSCTISTIGRMLIARSAVRESDEMSSPSAMPANPARAAATTSSASGRSRRLPEVGPPWRASAIGTRINVCAMVSTDSTNALDAT